MSALTEDPSSVSNSQKSEGPMWLQELREELADKLTGLMKAHHGRQHPSCNPEPEGTECGFDPESCPEPLIASMPLPANLCCSPASPAVSAPHTPSTAHPRPTPLSSSRKPPTGAWSSATLEALGMAINLVRSMLNVLIACS